jgi:CHAT domain-containing protein/Tfp pilus assembly protein PilF
MIDLRSATEIQRAVVYNDIGVTYKRMGLYKEAEKKYNEALTIYEKNGCEPVEEYIHTLNNIGVLYSIKGNYDITENYFKKALSLSEKTFSKISIAFSTRLNNLAALYLEIGLFNIAENYFLKSLQISKMSINTNKINYINCLNNIGGLYKAMKNFPKAISFYQATIEEMENVNFVNNSYYLKALENLIHLFIENDDIKQSEKLLKKLELSTVNISSLYSVDYSKYLIDKSKLYSKLGQSEKASILLEKALEINMQQTGKNTLLYSKILSEQATLRTRNKQHKETSNLLLEAIKIQNLLFTHTSFQFAEKEALLFLKKINKEYNLLLETLLTHFSQDMKKIEEAYINIILRKSIILEMTMIQNIMLRRYKQEDNSILLERFKKEYIPKLLNIDYEKILNKLDKNSVFVDIYYLDQTDRYIMFVIRPNAQIDLIDLGNGKELNQLIEDYRRSIVDPDFRNRHQVLSEQISSLFFSTFKNKYPEKLIISPVNELSKLPFETLMTSDGFYLIEKTFIKYISSVKDVVEESPRKGEKTFSVVSNPDFNYPFETFNTNHGIEENEFEKSMSFRNFVPEGTHFPSLKGIQKEGKIVSDILKKNNWQKDIELSGKDATISNVKKLNSSSIIHFVTHGYYFYTTLNTNPLKDCGLAFSGVNTVIDQNESLDKELKDEIGNGVLTAYDMTFMNLENTELMVLSACKTGLGQIVNGNGVLGFQRAVLLAGVKKMILTLFNIPDHFSSEIIEIFYKEYVISENAEEALRKAKLFLIDKSYNELGHADPILWGGYVCISRSF